MLPHYLRKLAIAILPSSGNMPSSPLPKVVQGRIVLALPGLVAGIAFSAGPLTAQEAPAPAVSAVQEIATPQENLEAVTAPETVNLNEPENLSVNPIVENDAGLDSSGAAASAEASMEELDKGVSQSFVFRAAVGGTYDRNLFLSESVPVSDIALVELLGVTYQSPEGKNTTFGFNYDVTASQYMDFSELDGMNHSATLKGALALAKANLQLNIKYDYLSNVAQDQLSTTAYSQQFQSSYANQLASQFTERQTLNAGLTGTKELGAKTVLTGSLGYAGYFYDSGAFQSYQQIYGQLGLGYRVTGKSTLGFAGAYGQLDNEGSQDQTFFSTLMTANYDATGKLVFSAQAGPQFIQYADAANGGTGEAADSTNFVFSLQSTYQMRVKTALRLSAYSNSNGSAAASGGNLDTTQVRLTLAQNIGQRFLLEVGTAYENNNYGAPVNSDSERIDRYWNGNARLIFQPSKKSSVGLFYNYLQNDSDALGASYDSSRFGAFASLSF